MEEEEGPEKLPGTFIVREIVTEIPPKVRKPRKRKNPDSDDVAKSEPPVRQPLRNCLKKSCLFSSYVFLLDSKLGEILC